MNKLKIGAIWVISILLGLSFLFAGWPKLMPGENMIRRFENWGYSPEFVLIVGVLELLAGITVLIPKTAFYGALLIATLMVGAIYTHIGSGIGSPVFAFIYLAAAVGVALVRFQSAILIHK